MITYIRNVYYGLVMRRLTARIARNDPPQGWNGSDPKEWA